MVQILDHKVFNGEILSLRYYLTIFQNFVYIVRAARFHSKRKKSEESENFKPSNFLNDKKSFLAIRSKK